MLLHVNQYVEVNLCQLIYGGAIVIINIVVFFRSFVV